MIKRYETIMAYDNLPTPGTIKITKFENSLLCDSRLE